MKPSPPPTAATWLLALVDVSLAVSSLLNENVEDGAGAAGAVLLVGAVVVLTAGVPAHAARVRRSAATPPAARAVAAVAGLLVITGVSSFRCGGGDCPRCKAR